MISFLFSKTVTKKSCYVAGRAKQKSHVDSKIPQNFASGEYIIFRNHRNQEHCVTKWHDKTLERVFSGLFTWVFGLARGFQLPSNMTWVYREGTYLQGKAGIPQIFGWTAMIGNIWRFHNRFQFAWNIFIIEQDDVYKFYVGYGTLQVVTNKDLF